MFRAQKFLWPHRTAATGSRRALSAVLREIVEQYVETGEPVGSRTSRAGCR